MIQNSGAFLGLGKTYERVGLQNPFSKSGAWEQEIFYPTHHAVGRRIPAN